MVIFTLRPLYRREGSSGTHRKEAGRDPEPSGCLLLVPGLKPRFLGRHPLAQALHRLS